jgi:hypothetical protein
MSITVFLSVDGPILFVLHVQTLDTICCDPRIEIRIHIYVLRSRLSPVDQSTKYHMQPATMNNIWFSTVSELRPGGGLVHTCAFGWLDGVMDLGGSGGLGGPRWS